MTNAPPRLQDKSTGRPFVALKPANWTAYKAPFDRIEGTQIAALMGKKIAAGLDADQWVQVWLQLHVNSDQKRLREFRNAVGLDQKGYWWIGKRVGAQQFLGDPKKFDQDYSINGPEPLL